jgi:hypothetical protein
MFAFESEVKLTWKCNGIMLEMAAARRGRGVGSVACNAERKVCSRKEWISWLQGEDWVDGLDMWVARELDLDVIDTARRDRRMQHSLLLHGLSFSKSVEPLENRVKTKSVSGVIFLQTYLLSAQALSFH